MSCDCEPEEEFDWKQVGITAGGYAIYECDELPGQQPFAVPFSAWRGLFAEPITVGPNGELVVE